MGLGDRIETWINEVSLIKSFTGYLVGVFSRGNRLASIVVEIGTNKYIDLFFYVLFLPFNITMYVILGMPVLLTPKLRDIITALKLDYSRLMGVGIQEIANTGFIQEPLEIVGSFISDPLFSILRTYAKQENPNHDEFLRAFYGYLVATPLIGSSLSTMVEFASFGTIKNAGKPIVDSYFTLGLGFMGWQGITPLLTNGVLIPMERQVKSEFRQTRYNTSQSLELYHRNLMEYDNLVQHLRWEGWRDVDIPNIIGLSWRSFSDGQLFDFHEKGLIDENTLKTKLRANGWKAIDIELLVVNNRANQIKDNKSASLATARKAYKLRIITEAQFTNLMNSLGFSPEAIQLELNVANFEDEIDNKTLSVSQLKAAYNTSQITQNEALTGLRDLGYTETDANILFETWQSSKILRVLRINQSTITKAVVQGILSADEALQKLMEIGYTREDAELIMATVNARGGGKKRLPSVSQVLAALQAKIITRSEADERLTTHGFVPRDIELLISLTESQNLIRTDENTILEAFLFGVFDEAQTRQKLQEIGATEDFITTRIDTFIKRRAKQVKAAPLAEVAKWLRHGLIDTTQAIERAIQNNLSQTDAELFVEAIGLGAPRTLSPQTIEDGLFYEIVTPNEALTLLRQTGLSAAQADTELAVIQKRIEHQTPRASISSLLDAARKGIISLEQFERKLATFLLDQDDIQAYLGLAVYEPSDQTTKLTKADILKAYREEEFDRFTAITFLESKGYTIEEAELLIRMERKDITDSLTHRLLISGAIDFETALSSIQSEGFSDAEISDWLDTLVAGGF